MRIQFKKRFFGIMGFPSCPIISFFHYSYISFPFYTFILLCLLLASGPSRAQTDVYLKLSTDQARQIGLAVIETKAPEPVSAETLARAQNLADIISADLEFSLYFKIIKAPIEQPDYGFTDGMLDINAWELLGAGLILAPELKNPGPGNLLVVRVYDCGAQAWVFDMGLPLTVGRDRAHWVADAIVKKFSGETGIASTRIAFCQQAGPHKEISVIDYDGFNPEKITRLKAASLSPDWSPDGRQVTFVAFTDHRQTMYNLDMDSRQLGLFPGKNGFAGAPAWSFDGTKIAFTLSHDGNSEVYIFLPGNGKRVRLTNIPSIDCSPGWSPTGRELAFVSDRAGSPQVYLMDSDGANVRRLTFEGTYNTSPVWSPRGDLIAYVSRTENLFQVCTIDVAGGTVSQLTRAGDNEDPSWSPDGLHLAFASTRSGVAEVWVMHWDGSGQRAVTALKGAYMPDWGPVVLTGH